MLLPEISPFHWGEGPTFTCQQFGFIAWSKTVIACSSRIAPNTVSSSAPWGSHENPRDTSQKTYDVVNDGRQTPSIRGEGQQLSGWVYECIYVYFQIFRGDQRRKAKMSHATAQSSWRPIQQASHEDGKVRHPRRDAARKNLRRMLHARQATVMLGGSGASSSAGCNIIKLILIYLFQWP